MASFKIKNPLHCRSADRKTIGFVSTNVNENKKTKTDRNHNDLIAI